MRASEASEGEMMAAEENMCEIRKIKNNDYNEVSPSDVKMKKTPLISIATLRIIALC